MAIELEPPEPDLSNIRKHLGAAPSLRRLFAWAGLATLALGALAITSQTKGGSDRLQQVIAAVASEPGRAIATSAAPVRAEPLRDEVLRVAEKDIETRRLEAKLRTLEADRDRLTARLASLERNLEDMTGSIKKQQQAVAPGPATPAPVIAAPTTAPPIVAMNVAPTSPPAAPSPPALAPLAMPGGAISTGWSNTPPVQDEPAVAPPITETVPIPPMRLASVPLNAPTPAPAKLDYGIDLGSAPNMDVLRARWAAVKANYGPLLTGFSPMAVRDRRPGSTDLRLLVGPLPNASAAKQLCERLIAVHARATCRTARYEGEALAQR